MTSSQPRTYRIYTYDPSEWTPLNATTTIGQNILVMDRVGIIGNNSAIWVSHCYPNYLVTTSILGLTPALVIISENVMGWDTSRLTINGEKISYTMGENGICGQITPSWRTASTSFTPTTPETIRQLHHHQTWDIEMFYSMGWMNANTTLIIIIGNKPNTTLNIYNRKTRLATMPPDDLRAYKILTKPTRLINQLITINLTDNYIAPDPDSIPPVNTPEQTIIHTTSIGSALTSSHHGSPEILKNFPHTITHTPKIYFDHKASQWINNNSNQLR